MWRASGWMCCSSALQVDLVGAEKINNSMGFAMFFVGLGCLTGPPLAGEWITSWKPFSQTRVNLLFKAHNNRWNTYVLHMYGRYCCKVICYTEGTWHVSERASEWAISEGVHKPFLWTYIFGGCCSTYFHGALNSLQCLKVCVCIQSLWSVKTETHYNL